MTYTLLPFQETDATWLMKQNSLLANDCGLGKTLTAVEAAKRYAQGPILVICPRLVKEWWREVIEDQDAGYVGVCGRAGRGIPWNRIANWGSRRPLAWVVVHPAAVRLSAQWLRLVPWDTIICDEAHRFKNRKAKQTKALRTLKARRKVMMTATPYGRSPADMWALLHWLYPTEFRSYWRFFEAYVESYRPKHQRFRVIQGPKNLKQLATVVAPFYRRRTKEDTLDLPALTYTDAPVAINGKQERLYLKLVRQAYAELVGKEIILENALVRFLRLHQCALDPALMAEGLPALPLKQVPAKVEWLNDWLEDHPNESVVIVSRYRKFVEKWLRELAPDATIVGGMKSQAVQRALRVFNKTGRMVGSLDAIKEGLNLQRASTMIIMDGTWSTTAEYQLANRIHRMGSKKPCQVIHLVAKLATSRKYTVDKLMRQALKKRMSDAELVNAFIAQLQKEGGK